MRLGFLSHVQGSYRDAQELFVVAHVAVIVAPLPQGSDSRAS